MCPITDLPYNCIQSILQICCAYCWFVLCVARITLEMILALLQSMANVIDEAGLTPAVQGP